MNECILIFFLIIRFKILAHELSFIQECVSSPPGVNLGSLEEVEPLRSKSSEFQHSYFILSRPLCSLTNEIFQFVKFN